MRISLEKVPASVSGPNIDWGPYPYWVMMQVVAPLSEQFEALKGAKDGDKFRFEGVVRLDSKTHPGRHSDLDGKIETLEISKIRINADG